jgi:hypothetical protein
LECESLRRTNERERLDKAMSGVSAAVGTLLTPMYPGTVIVEDENGKPNATITRTKSNARGVVERQMRATTLVEKKRTRQPAYLIDEEGSLRRAVVVPRGYGERTAIIRAVQALVLKRCKVALSPEAVEQCWKEYVKFEKSLSSDND